MPSITSEESPVCPHCNRQSTEIEDYTDAITFWGEKIIDITCPECGHEYWVKEIVRRKWRTSIKKPRE